MGERKSGENDVFDAINLMGFTLGASTIQKNTSSSFGLVYTRGSNSNARVFDPVTGDVESRNLKIESYSLALSGSVFF